MKGAGKIILIVTMVTSSLLLYVHLHVSLFHVSYAINEQSQALTQRAEAYRHLKYDVDQLKAPRRLEKKINEHSLDLILPKQIEVVRIPHTSLPSVSAERQTAASTLAYQFSNFIGRWVGVAQAKTDTQS